MYLFTSRNAALAAALLLAGCNASANAPPPAPPLVAVEVTPVVVQPLRQWDDFTGRLEAIQAVEVRPRVGGYIDAATLPEGAHVHKGQLLFQIDPRPFKAEVDRAAAQLLRAKADASLAQANADRAKRLIAEQAIAQGEFDREDAAAKGAAADVEAAQAALDTARLNLSFTHVTSPIDGRVSKALITRGNLVTTASLLTTVVSDGPIYATFNADEQTFLKYAEAQRGQGGPVYMGLMTETGFPRKGRLQFLDNSIDPKSGTIDGRALFDNADGKLTPGLFARIRLVSTKTDPVALAAGGRHRRRSRQALRPGPRRPEPRAVPARDPRPRPRPASGRPCGPERGRSGGDRRPDQGEARRRGAADQGGRPRGRHRRDRSGSDRLNGRPRSLSKTRFDPVKITPRQRCARPSSDIAP